MYIVTYQISFLSSCQLTSSYVLMSHALLLYICKIGCELPVIKLIVHVYQTCRSIYRCIVSSLGVPTGEASDDFLASTHIIDKYHD